MHLIYCDDSLQSIFASENFARLRNRFCVGTEKKENTIRKSTNAANLDREQNIFTR